MQVEIIHLAENDVSLLQSLNAMFGEAFNDPESYAAKKPSSSYLQKLLANPTFFALVAVDNGLVVGGLAAYEFQKFEQQRSELYIYDLAVLTTHRRQGVATALIEKLKAIGKKRGAYVVFVQSDKGVEDQPAIALYSKLGTREDVFHFDFAIEGQNGHA
ncbi:AAC(3)-I family aminoglycoside N-acetyltransferase [Thiothrix lacustris]|uniref:AAC(3)-I family aminoglycoside N-acetyltransferase n=1 Tax=Thiothrix lacustris TaxID=525917 RepID=UPI00048A9D73|nr:AAC(3)-I family aminoglycoside N-acetyltransferase [Thiothrix lacustris]